MKNHESLDLKHLPTKLARRLILVRYALSAAAVPLFLIVGIFHSVLAEQGGYTIWVSPVRLCFNTLKNARAHFLAGGTGNGSLFGFFLAGVIVAILAFLAALALKAFSLSQLYLYLKASTPDEKRAAAVRHKTVFPNRVFLFLSDLLILVPALFCEYVYAVSNRFTGGGIDTLFVKCNVPLILLLVLLAATLALSILLAPQEGAAELDLFDTREQIQGGTESENEAT